MGATSTPRKVQAVSESPSDPIPPGGIGDEPGLDWLSDGAAAEDGLDPALWPTEPVEMDPLPGFTLDDDSVLVPIPSPAMEGEAGAGGGVGQPTGPRRGRRLRLSLGKAIAGASALGAAALTAAVVYGGVGVPPPGGSDAAHQPPPELATTSPPIVPVDTSWTERVDRLMTATRERERRQTVARRRAQVRLANRQAPSTPSPPTPSSAPAEVAVTSAPATSAEIATDPWASVPPAVREFEPGPWNQGGSS